MRTLNHLLLTVLILPFIGLNSCKKEFKLSENSHDTFHVKNGDYEIPVLVRGNTLSKKIIVYIQGGPAANTLDFATIDYPEWKNTLEKKYAIAYYEQRGNGNGQGNFELNKNILDTYLSDIHALCEFLKKAYNADIILMGHSFGGGLMLRYMVEKGEQGIPASYIALNAPVTTDKSSASLRWQFRREFLYNTALLEISRSKNIPEWNEVLNWLAITPVIQETNGSNKYELFDKWNSYVEKLVYAYYPEKDLKLRDYFKAIFLSPYNPLPAYLGEDFNGGLGSMILNEEDKYQLVLKLNKINHQKILLLTGRYDDICVPEEMNYVYSQITSPNKELQILDLCGHDSFIHQPTLFVTTIENFIR